MLFLEALANSRKENASLTEKSEYRLLDTESRREPGSPNSLERGGKATRRIDSPTINHDAGR